MPFGSVSSRSVRRSRTSAPRSSPPNPTSLGAKSPGCGTNSLIATSTPPMASSRRPSTWTASAGRRRATHTGWARGGHDIAGNLSEPHWGRWDGIPDVRAHRVGDLLGRVRAERCGKAHGRRRAARSTIVGAGRRCGAPLARHRARTAQAAGRWQPMTPRPLPTRAGGRAARVRPRRRPRPRCGVIGRGSGAEVGRVPVASMPVSRSAGPDPLARRFGRPLRPA